MSKSSPPTGHHTLSMEDTGCPRNDRIYSHGLDPQAQEISGKLQPTPVAHWKKLQKPNVREASNKVT